MTPPPPVTGTSAASASSGSTTAKTKHDNKHDPTRTKPSVLAQILGNSSEEAIRNTKLLVVGAGGIGCEVLKNLVLHGFRRIEVTDLDTIDVTNLNRQFLFRKHHVDQSKSSVACETVKKFLPVGELENLQLTSHRQDVKTFDMEFFKKFDVIVNCLDNIGARHHVNRVCVGLGMPLLEAGTTGYAGQSTVHIPHKTECYECLSRPKPKKFPVCTIRKTPDKPIHCVTWAKHLFDALFGPSDDTGNVLSDLRDSLAIRKTGTGSSTTSAGDENQNHGDSDSVVAAALNLVDKLFRDDIQALYSSGEIKKSWSAGRPKPKLLKKVEELLLVDSCTAGDGDEPGAVTVSIQDAVVEADETVVEDDQENPADLALGMQKSGIDGVLLPNPTEAQELELQKEQIPQRPAGVPTATTKKIAKLLADFCQKEKTQYDWNSDQNKIWTAKRTVLKLIQSVVDTVAVLKKQDGDKTISTVTFSKENETSVDFVTAVSNLRSLNYSIKPIQTKWEVTSMAGNIVPAIATTNAIVAGLQVANLMHLVVTDRLEELVKQDENPKGTTGRTGGPQDSSTTAGASGPAASTVVPAKPHQNPTTTRRGQPQRNVLQDLFLTSAPPPAGFLAPDVKMNKNTTSSTKEPPPPAPSSATTSFPAVSINHSLCRDAFPQYPEPSRTRRGNFIITSGPLQKPNPNCLVCGEHGSESSKKVTLYLAEEEMINKTTIAEFVTVCLKSYFHFHEPSVSLQNLDSFAQIYDPDYPTACEEALEEGLHPDWALGKLNVRNDSRLTFCDESQVGCEFDAVVVVVPQEDWNEENYPEFFAVNAVECDLKNVKKEEVDLQVEKQSKQQGRDHHDSSNADQQVEHKGRNKTEQDAKQHLTSAVELLSDDDDEEEDEKPALKKQKVGK